MDVIENAIEFNCNGKKQVDNTAVEIKTEEKSTLECMQLSNLP